MALIMLSEMEHNGVRYALMAPEVDPTSFEGGAEEIEVTPVVQCTVAPEKAKRSRAKSA